MLPLNIVLTFDEFARRYRAAYHDLWIYTPMQIGFQIACARLAELAHEYPDWAASVERELE